MHIALSTAQDRTLLQPVGQVLAMGQELRKIVLNTDQPLPDRLTIDLAFQKNEEPPVDKMRALLNYFADRVSLENKNWFQQLKVHATRKLVGFSEKFPRLRLAFDPQKPKLVSLNLDIQGIERKELDHFSTFLENNAKHLADGSTSH